VSLHETHNTTANSMRSTPAPAPKLLDIAGWAETHCARDIRWCARRPAQSRRTGCGHRRRRPAGSRAPVVAASAGPGRIRAPPV